MSLASKIIIANWKANPSSLKEAQDLFAKEVGEAAMHSRVKTVICPPVIYLEELSKMLHANFPQASVSLGVQDMGEAAGPLTGEVSPEMVRNFGVDYVLIGHSERRYTLGESDRIINRKVVAAIGHRIIPVLLVGEKEQNDYRYDVLAEQLRQDLVGLNSLEVSKVLTVYEPAWAVSSHPDSHADTPAEALRAIEMIREVLFKTWKLEQKETIVLYGGSVNEHNLLSFLEHPEIDGVIVGGASLSIEKFGHILKLTDNLQVRKGHDSIH